MRIISGTLRGKKLVTLEGIETRPTLDRVKEALFNIVQFDIADTDVLDLFAGSGNLGIEALSRNAKSAIFCDNSPDAIKIIKKNIENAKLENKSIIMKNDYILALDELNKQNKKLDIIFLDPPYRTNFGMEAINKIIELDLLNNNGIIIFETNDINKEKEIIENKGIKIVDKRKYGKVILMFIRKE